MLPEPISKLLFLINPQLIVIPAEAGIHVFQVLKWTRDFSGVTAFLPQGIRREKSDV
jgi:hypothetical protein